MEGRAERELLKENVAPRAPLSTWWLCGALAATALALAAAAAIDAALPEPLARGAPDHRFIAEIAHEHLVNLTSIGPRVAGSYENEVLAVGAVLAGARRAAAGASPHNRVELDVQTASGAFPIAFLDGMNNVYRDVQSVVARVAGAGGARGPALLLNCHFDTVPDSPGASDDGAGCAVLLETLRALAAWPRPLRRSAVFLFNGAEENIMQAAHGFVTQHPWAGAARAFVNIEACGAGGREVLFQAGPHDPWILEAYAAAAPRPFASSLAQELFESGLIPADTDFRVFRDFGNLSGVDLAWSTNGYVYHTALDTADRVPPAALQRTGDNVLALAHALLASDAMDEAPDAASRQPVFFDVLGAFVVAARAPAAAAAAALTLAVVALKIHLTASDAARRLYITRAAWWARVRGAGARSALAGACGAAAALAVALALHAAGARLAFYARPALLAPLYALPTLGAAWAAAARLRGGGAARGWWEARAWHDAGCGGAALLLAACALRGLRSGFVPLLWALPPAAADAAASLARVGGGARAALWAAGAALPMLQTCYLALGSLHTFVPLMGRAGAGPVPPDAAMAGLAALLTLAATGWTLPLVAAARRPLRPAGAALALCAATAALVLATPLGAPYSAERPQRFMVFHTRRTLHPPAGGERAPRVDDFYWVPRLDANTPHSVAAHVPGAAAARPLDGDCERLLYCGAPYFLPALSLVRASHALAADAAPLVRLRAELRVAPLNGSAAELLVQASGPQRVVLIVAPAEGCALAWSSAVAAPQRGPRWGARRTYFFLLHAARPAPAWRLRLRVACARAPPHWADVSLAGHALHGAAALHPRHRALLAAFPRWAAPTGWGVDLHLYRV